MKPYSMEIANAVREFLDGKEFRYDFREDDGSFSFRLNIGGRFGDLQYKVYVRESLFSVLSIFPISVDHEDEQELARVAEFITRANYGMTFGCFQMDYRDGELSFRDTISSEAGIPVSEQVAHSIYVPAATYGRYREGIMEMIFFDTSPADAIDVCENSDLEDIHQNMKALHNNDK